MMATIQRTRNPKVGILCILFPGHFKFSASQVMARHRLASPDCPFVRDQSDNVPFVNGEEEGDVVDGREEEETQADEAPAPPESFSSPPHSRRRHRAQCST